MDFTNYFCTSEKYKQQNSSFVEGHYLDTLKIMRVNYLANLIYDFLLEDSILNFL